MLTILGLPFLRWLDDDVLPEAYRLLDTFGDYLDRWRELLEGEERARGEYWIHEESA